jgi:hypothetical protein
MNLIYRLIVLFIPHKHNGYRPRILEVESFKAIIVVLVLLKLLSIISYENNLGAVLSNQIVQSDLYAMTNQARANNELPVLRVSSKLEEVAQLKLLDMETHSYFAHVSPQGVTPWAWFDKVHYDYQVAGENLAMDFDSSSGVMHAWLASPDHCKNILYPNFSEIGIAAGTAIIDGQKRLVVVQEFGQPTLTSVVASKSSPLPTPKKLAQNNILPTPTPAMRSLTSEAIHFMDESSGVKQVAAEPAVAGVTGATPSVELSYISWSMIQLIFVLVALAAIGLFIINLFMRIHSKFPTLLVRSAILVAIAVLLLLIKDYQFLFNHVILP